MLEIIYDGSQNDVMYIICHVFCLVVTGIYVNELDFKS